MYGDLKLTFMQKTMHEYMVSVKKAIALKMRQRGVGVTNDALNSLAHTVVSAGPAVTGNLIFKEYLRFVDMGVGRGNALGGLKERKVALQASRFEGNVLGKKTRKKNPVYSKTAWGNLTWLQNKLLYGFTEETIAMLKKELEEKQNAIV